MFVTFTKTRGSICAQMDPPVEKIKRLVGEPDEHCHGILIVRENTRIEKFMAASNFKKLSILRISNCGVCSVQFPKALDDLNYLDLSTNSLTNTRFLDMKALTTLNLSNNKLQSYDAHHLPALQSLNLSMNCITHLNGLERSPEFETLDISNNKIDKTFTGFGVLAECPRLRNLDISYNNLDSLDHLGFIRSLVSFKANHNRFKIADFGRFVYNDLIRLELSNNNLARLPHLSAPNLQVIVLDYNRIASKFIRKNSFRSLYQKGLGWPSLKELSLRSNRLEIVHLAGMVQLTELYLEDNCLMEFPHIEDPSRLVHMDLNRNGFTHIPDLTRYDLLSYLNIGKNPIKSVGDFSACSSLRFLAIAAGQLAPTMLSRLAIGRSETAIQELQFCGQSNMVLPVAMGGLHGLKWLKWLRSGGQLPISMGMLPMCSPCVFSTSDLHKWGQTLFPMFLTPETLEIIACFGPQCRRAITTTLLCLQEPEMPFVGENIAFLIFSHWQIKNWTPPSSY